MLCTCGYLGDGLVDVHPARQGVDPEVLRLLAGHRVRDGGVGAKVIVMSGHPQEAGPGHGVLTEEVCERREEEECWTAVRRPSR